MPRKLMTAVLVVAALAVAYHFFRDRSATRIGPLNGEAIICFGDSLTYGTGAPADKSYPARLEQLLGRPVINRGVPGDTTAGALARLQKDVLDRSPRIVLITIGGNDLRRGVAVRTAQTNLEAILLAIRRQGALAVVGGIDIPLLDRGYGRMYEEATERTGAVLVKNILAGILGHDALMSDQIHPNAAGYAIMAQRFHSAIEPYL